MSQGPGLFRRLRERGPKESFFDLFVIQVTNISEAAASLKDMVESLEVALPSMREKAGKMKTLEERGDDICRKIYDKVDKTFITPACLDEEDIRSLTRYLDNILDMIEKAASRLVVFRIEKASSELQRLVALLQSMVGTLETLITEFRKGLSRDLSRICAEVHRYEEEMDRLYRGALTELFSQGNSLNTRELIAWKDIYEIIESAADCCHDAVAVVEGILSKNKVI